MNVVMDLPIIRAIFHAVLDLTGYNRMHNDVPLKEEIFGKNFLQCYMYALDSKIKELQKEFDEL